MKKKRKYVLVISILLTILYNIITILLKYNLFNYYSSAYLWWIELFLMKILHLKISLCLKYNNIGTLKVPNSI